MENFSDNILNLPEDNIEPSYKEKKIIDMLFSKPQLSLDSYNSEKIKTPEDQKDLKKIIILTMLFLILNLPLTDSVKINSYVKTIIKTIIFFSILYYLT